MHLQERSLSGKYCSAGGSSPQIVKHITVSKPSYQSCQPAYKG